MSEGQLKRVLYVEDDPDVQTVARIALEMVGGFTLCACSSGEEALQAAADFEPQLLLLDVMMPGMDGPATLVGLRGIAQTAATPCIFMTAKVQSGELAHYHALGALGVISKPFDPMLLAIEVLRMWENR